MAESRTYRPPRRTNDAPVDLNFRACYDHLSALDLDCPCDGRDARAPRFRVPRRVKDAATKLVFTDVADHLSAIEAICGCSRPYYRHPVLRPPRRVKDADTMLVFRDLYDKITNYPRVCPCPVLEQTSGAGALVEGGPTTPTYIYAVEDRVVYRTNLADADDGTVVWETIYTHAVAVGWDTLAIDDDDDVIVLHSTTNNIHTIDRVGQNATDIGVSSTINDGVDISRVFNKIYYIKVALGLFTLRRCNYDGSGDELLAPDMVLTEYPATISGLNVVDELDYIFYYSGGNWWRCERDGGGITNLGSLTADEDEGSIDAAANVFFFTKSSRTLIEGRDLEDLTLVYTPTAPPGTASGDLRSVLARTDTAQLYVASRAANPNDGLYRQDYDGLNLTLLGDLPPGGNDVESMTFSTLEVTEFRLTPDAWYTRSTAGWPIVQMTKKRAYHVSVLGPDGRIYTFGGIDETGARLSDIEVFDPVANTSATFTPSGSGSFTGVWGAAAAVVGTKAYIIGGRLSSDDSYSDLVQVFDFNTASWSSGTVMPVTGRYRAIAVVGSDLYLVGGETSAGVRTNRTDIYHTLGDAWTAGPTYPQTYMGMRAAAVGDVIYCYGGSDGTAQRKLYELDTGAGSPAWSALTDGTYDQAWHALGVLGEDVYVGPGTNKQIERYDVSADSYATRTVPPDVQYIAWPVVRSGLLYVMGGLSAVVGGVSQDYINAYVPPGGGIRPY